MTSQSAAYGFFDEQRAIRQKVDEFEEDEIEPVATGYDDLYKYPTEILEQDLIAPNAPIKCDGAGINTLSSIFVTEEL